MPTATCGIPNSETKGQDELSLRLSTGHLVQVDPEDHERFGGLKWNGLRKGRAVYAIRSAKQSDGSYKSVLLHRLILEVVDGQLVDHINGDTLDCRRHNLRKTDYTGNARNCRHAIGASGYRGVIPNGSLWRGRVRACREVHHTASVTTPLEAAVLRDLLATQLHGDFALLNFPAQTMS